MLLPNVIITIVYRYYITSYDQFKFEIWKPKIQRTGDDFVSHIRNMIFHPKTSKIPNLQKCYQYGLKPIIEGVMSTICKMDLVVYFWPNKWT